MSIKSTKFRLQLNLIVVLVVSVLAPASFASDGCWVLSTPGSNPELTCKYSGLPGETGLPCIELEEDGFVMAADCCEPSADCTNTCAAGSPAPGGTIIRPTTFRFAPPAGTSLKADTEIRHVTPRLPVLVDHVAVAPESLNQFDGVALHFLICQDDGGRIDLRAFTAWHDLESQVQTCFLKDSSFAVPEAPHRTASGIAVYEAPKWGGASYVLSNGQSVVFEDSWWNDRISSLRGIGAGTFITFFEAGYLGGSSLTLATGFGWPDLSVFGWEDRASSAVVWSADRELLPFPFEAADRFVNSK